MSQKIVCWQPEAGQEPNQGGWRRVESPPYLRRGHERDLVLELPASGSRHRAFVNGMPAVGGIQVLRTGDLLLLVDGDTGAATSYIIGQTELDTEAGEGCVCQFTGLAIRGNAVRCACGAVFAEDVRRQLAVCPRCGGTFDQTDHEPPMELL